MSMELDAVGLAFRSREYIRQEQREMPVFNAYHAETIREATDEVRLKLIALEVADYEIRRVLRIWRQRFKKDDFLETKARNRFAVAMRAYEEDKAEVAERQAS